MMLGGFNRFASLGHRKKGGGAVSGHRYWSLRSGNSVGGNWVNLAQLQWLTAANGTDAVPPYASNTALVQASTIKSTQLAGHEGYLIYNDLHLTGDWESGPGGAVNGRIGYDFGTPVGITGFTLTTGTYAAEMPTSLIVEYSDDGTNWVADSGWPTMTGLSVGTLRLFHVTKALAKSPSAQFGANSISDAEFSGAAGWNVAVMMQATSSFTANTMYIMGGPTSAMSAAYRLSIYAATSATVISGALLGNTADPGVTVPPMTVVALPLVAPVSIVSGNWYAFGLHMSSATSPVARHTSTVGYGYADAYADGLLATAPAGANYPQGPVIWCS